MDAGLTFGLAAGGLHALGLAVYLRDIRRGRCRPNRMGWTLAGLGTVVYAGIAGDLGAAPPVLILPGVAAAGAMIIAALALARGAGLAPEPQDWVTLAFDASVRLWLALLVLGPAAGLGLGAETGPVFAALAGLGVLTAAWPVLRTTGFEPRNERPMAWFLWSAAHGSMALAVMREAMSWHHLIYPVLSQAVLLMIGVFALPQRESVAPDLPEPAA